MSSPDLQLGRGQVAPVRQRNHDRPASLDNPRSPRRRAGMPNFEKYAWLFMRFSGIVLVFLALGHLFVMLMWQDGVYRIDFNYVAQRWHSPFWQTWDLLLLWLAQLHGGNGLAHHHRRLQPQGFHPLLAEHPARLVDDFHVGAGHLCAVDVRPEYLRG